MSGKNSQLEKEMVSLSGNKSDLEVRVRNSKTKEVIGQFLIDKGAVEGMKNLNKNQDYLVEIRGEMGRYTLNVY